MQAGRKEQEAAHLLKIATERRMRKTVMDIGLDTLPLYEVQRVDEHGRQLSREIEAPPMELVEHSRVVYDNPRGRALLAHEMVTAGLFLGEATCMQDVFEQSAMWRKLWELGIWHQQNAGEIVAALFGNVRPFYVATKSGETR